MGFESEHEYSQLGLHRLYLRAVEQFCHSAKAKCSFLYRNKWPRYFENIINERSGIMNPYFKEAGNDPLNPMNKRLGGLFFTASVKNMAGELPDESAFGQTRLVVPVENLVEKMNLYFADFFCIKGVKHYVTLVVCKPNTKSDDFCKQKLLEINLTDNVFFTSVGFNNYQVAFNSLLSVDVVITQPIDIEKEMRSNVRSAYIIHGVKTVDCGFSKKSGIFKNDSCTMCNIPTYNCTQARSNMVARESRKCRYGDINKKTFIFNTVGKYVHKQGLRNGNDWMLLKQRTHSKPNKSVPCHNHDVSDGLRARNVTVNKPDQSFAPKTTQHHTLNISCCVLF